MDHDETGTLDLVEFVLVLEQLSKTGGTDMKIQQNTDTGYVEDELREAFRMIGHGEETVLVSDVQNFLSGEARNHFDTVNGMVNPTKKNDARLKFTEFEPVFLAAV